MSISGRTPAWLIYERCVAAMAAERFGGSDVVVQANAMLLGVLSGQSRQIDVLIDSRYPDLFRKRIIIDAKRRLAKLDINDVEAFEGMMRDCQATHGVIVTSSGSSPAATRRAQDAITLSILSVDEALSFDWSFEPCLGGCTREAGGATRGMVLWDGPVTPDLRDRPAYIIRVGKCDGCRQFHVWCWGCGRRFVVPDTAVVDCDCARWISVPEAALSERDGEPESVWLTLLLEGMLIPVDRRPISQFRPPDL